MLSPLKVSSSLMGSRLFQAGPPSAGEVEAIASMPVTRGAGRAPRVILSHASRMLSHFNRRPQRSPDREASVKRRRTWGGAGQMPHVIRCHYTEGQRAALAVIAHHVRSHGHCDLPIDQIAALAGVSRTTVQNALRQARALGHVSKMERPRAGQKSLTNVVRIIAPEWLAWLDHGGKAADSIGFNSLNPTKTGSETRGVCEGGSGAKGLGDKGRWRRMRLKQTEASR